MSRSPRPCADYLVVSPPVCSPSEPPSGAFLLAAALQARGRSVFLLDLSLEFYLRIFDRAGDGQVRRALDYLRGGSGRLTPQGHRTACGFLHSELSRESEKTGWKTTLMDLEPPCGCHSPSRILELCEQGPTPFAGLFEEVLDPVLDDLRPGTVLVSASYLSQLAGAVSTVRHVTSRGFGTITGGSLLNSLRETGEGSIHLERVLGRVEYGDGSILTGAGGEEPFLGSLSWPGTAGRTDYVSPLRVIPFALSTGCFWNRCLFCPDRTQPFRRIGPGSLASLLESAPSAEERTMVHLLDSAVPPQFLSEALPVLEERNASFYGFARPSADLLGGDLLERAAQSGCAMLQYGVESADGRILGRFCKGIDPDTAAAVLERTAGLGIRTYAYFLFGLPGEDRESREKTAAFVENNLDSIDFANFSVFNLPVRCELADRAADFGIEPDGSHADEGIVRFYLPFSMSGGSPRFEVRRFLSGASTAGSGVRAVLNRTPKWFRASHMAMMDMDGRTPCQNRGLSSENAR
ncbi:MAG: hypothetical protein QUS11_09815 [Candidatus Fermentibacter sp.]|nr:hypothetical protein [Candidatus Fermentibacter sp.]